MLYDLIHGGQERRRRVALLRRWVEANWDEDATIDDLVAKHAEVPLWWEITAGFREFIWIACDRKMLSL